MTTSEKKNPIYDVIVIGAGIQGAGIAQACALNGWRVLVLEKNQSAGLETSSASSKLIHGGLRYLETLQLGLVYECLQERSRLLRNAEDITQLVPFYIPVYDKSKRSAIWVFLGLSLYSVLGGLSPSSRFKILNSKEITELGIEGQGLKTVFQYFDAQTDDRALTERVLSNAVGLGANVEYNSLVNSVNSGDEGFQVETANQSFVSRCVINVTGPWVNQTPGRSSNLPTREVSLVQGTHIVLNRKSPAGCFYVEALADSRPMFVLPWKGVTLVGTTERLLEGPQAEASDEEVEYLLQSYNQYFPEQICDKSDIVEVMAGARVLPLSDKKANERSRETLLSTWEADGQLYMGVYGGKLTSYRAVSERIAKKVAEVIKPTVGQFKNSRDVKI